MLGHIEANQLKAQDSRQLAGYLGLAHTGRARQQKRTDRLVARAQTGSGEFYRRRQAGK